MNNAWKIEIQNERLETSRKAAAETVDYESEREDAMNEKFGIID